MNTARMRGASDLTTAETVDVAVRMMSGALDGLAFAARRETAAMAFDLCLTALGFRKG